MRRVSLEKGPDLDGFRRAARALVAEGLAPRDVVFEEAGNASLLPEAEIGEAPPLALPKSVPPIIATVAMHRDPARWALLYELVWRVLHGERRLAEIVADPLMHQLHVMKRNIGRDIHKMHAFVRFRQVEGAEPERYAAWFEPDHHILRAVGPFFRDRFGAMLWSIYTPDGSIHWDRERLAYGPPGRKEDAPAKDGFEDGWRDYYGAIFNPARVNPTAMRAEMPKKYWKNLPEAEIIPDLVRGAASRVGGMMDREPTMPTKREPRAALDAMIARERPASLDALAAQIRAYEPPADFSRRAVIGEGPIEPVFAFVGEQPGDVEDQEGRPFVGPAGRMLAKALGEVGIDRDACYVTNAVKHFKFVERGKRRIHQKPSLGEIKHYRWWLMQELELVRPQLVIALGATALTALTGKQMPLLKSRGPASFARDIANDEDAPALPGYVTVHPSYLLRLPDEEAKAKGYADFVRDLAEAKALAA
ncbi:UdgX family uracil-DNA binding protein [Salinarimonas ramus]|uniref:Type-4 uracil-DNA glycosylase n=1 Tax=Salinarimonas ramus TaxID=690164 RepID=A0A917V304_9HYPH|nr:UdgX family uracil-DNA binding protein [Salinarimonas ramus]GGK26493.1 uracil-DNA glycosylase [Salinarimonas ramus]